MGVAQNLRAKVTLVLVFGSIYKGAALVHVFEPQQMATPKMRKPSEQRQNPMDMFGSIVTCVTWLQRFLQAN